MTDTRNNTKARTKTSLIKEIMKLILCLDKNNGIAFNNRRQSQDQEVTADIVRLATNSMLWISKYSEALFSGYDKDRIKVSDEFISQMRACDYAFVEVEIPDFDINQVDEIIIYWWNRDYPSDVRLDATILNEFNKISSVDFAGFSHEKITKEVYKR